MSLTNTASNSEELRLISSGQEYQVFLSFRGPDTRVGFTDHLYTRLVDTGIKTYRDEDDLRVGEEIGPELLEGINQSKIAIPVFSKGYAASKWCLQELAHIVECKRSRGLKVMPVFYHIKPSEVRNQTGDFAEAFALHEQSYDDETIREWRRALKEVGKLTGWHIESYTNGYEGTLVKNIVEVVQHEIDELQREIKKPLSSLEKARKCLVFSYPLLLYLFFTAFNIFVAGFILHGIISHRD